MKQIFSMVFLPFMILLFSCNENYTSLNPTQSDTTKPSRLYNLQEEEETVFDSLEARTLLKRLYDNPEIDNNNEALWIPNYAEGMELSVSYDGRCHTALDTIMYFEDSKNDNCAVAIFTNYYYVKSNENSTKKEITGSHFD